MTYTGSHLPFRLRRLLGILLLLSSLPLLAAAQPPPPPPDAITVQLDWLPSAQFAGVLLAQARGYYRAQNLRVTILPSDSDMEPFARIAAASNIVGISEADSLLVERARYPQLRAFATMMQSTPFCLITLKQSGLTTIPSLRGKRIGLHGDGHRTIDELLHYNGMTLSDVTLVDIPLSLDPLISGQVDAIQGYTNDEVVRLTLAHHPVNIIPMASNGYVSYAEVLFTSAAMLQQKPDALLRFLRATRQGWQAAAANPHKTAVWLVRTYLPHGSIPEQEQSLLQVIPLLNAETHDSRNGQMNPATWDKSLAMFHKYQSAEATFTAADLVDYSILNRLDPQ